MWKFIIYLTSVLTLARCFPQMIEDIPEAPKLKDLDFSSLPDYIAEAYNMKPLSEPELQPDLPATELPQEDSVSEETTAYVEPVTEEVINDPIPEELEKHEEQTENTENERLESETKVVEKFSENFRNILLEILFPFIQREPKPTIEPDSEDLEDSRPKLRTEEEETTNEESTSNVEEKEVEIESNTNEEKVGKTRTYGFNIRGDHGYIWNDLFTDPGMFINIGKEIYEQLQPNVEPELGKEDLEDIFVNISEDDKRPKPVAPENDAENPSEGEPEPKPENKGLLAAGAQLVTILQSQEFVKWFDQWSSFYGSLVQSYLKNKINEQINKELDKADTKDESQSEETDELGNKFTENIFINGKSIPLTDTSNINIDALVNNEDNLRGHKRPSKENKKDSKIEAGTIYGNAVDNDKVTNLFIFFDDKHASEALKEILPLIGKGNKENCVANAKPEENVATEAIIEEPVTPDPFLEPQPAVFVDLAETNEPSTENSNIYLENKEPSEEKIKESVEIEKTTEIAESSAVEESKQPEKKGEEHLEEVTEPNKEELPKTQTELKETTEELKTEEKIEESSADQIKEPAKEELNPDTAEENKESSDKAEDNKELPEKVEEKSESPDKQVEETITEKQAEVITETESKDAEVTTEGLKEEKPAEILPEPIAEVTETTEVLAEKKEDNVAEDVKKIEGEEEPASKLEDATEPLVAESTEPAEKPEEATEGKKTDDEGKEASQK